MSTSDNVKVVRTKNKTEHITSSFRWHQQIRLVISVLYYTTIGMCQKASTFRDGWRVTQAAPGVTRCSAPHGERLFEEPGGDVFVPSEDNQPTNLPTHARSSFVKTSAGIRNTRVCFIHREREWNNVVGKLFLLDFVEGLIRWGRGFGFVDFKSAHANIRRFELKGVLRKKIRNSRKWINFIRVNIAAKAAQQMFNRTDP